MKRYLVISDLHGSYEAAKVAIEQFHERNCDAILCLGDVLYHGPRNHLPNDYDPKQVIDLLNQEASHIIAVRGNCDAEVDQMVLDFPLLSTTNTFLLGSRAVVMSHGHVYGRDHLPTLKEGDIFLSGHTHIPTCDNENEIYLLNPGSSALPKEGHPKTYAVLEETSFTIYTFDQQSYMSINF